MSWAVVHLTQSQEAENEISPKFSHKYAKFLSIFSVSVQLENDPNVIRIRNNSLRLLKSDHLFTSTFDASPSKRAETIDIDKIQC